MSGVAAGVTITKRCFLLLGVVALVGSSCDVKRMSATFGKLFDLQRKLEAKFSDEAIGVEVANDELLTITLTNSPNANLDPPEREKKARTIAAFAYANYAEPAKLSSVGVVFMIEKKFLVFESTEPAANYTFSPADLATPAPSSSAPTPGVDK
jgi:spore coat protein U-like protein